MIKAANIEVGDKVTVLARGNSLVEGVVTNVSEDIKNGVPGIDYSVDEFQFWAYEDQIVEHFPAKKQVAA